MITTVLGDVKAETVGHIIPHEHIYCNMSGFLNPSDDPDFFAPLSLSNYGKVRLNPYAVLDNCILDSEELMIFEIKQFKAAGGDMYVDLGRGKSRRPESFQRISKETGVKIVAGCGIFLSPASAEEDAMTEEDVYNMIMRDLTVGIDGTDVKAGIIGEMGSGDVMTEFQKKGIRAAARAQKETGAGLQIHASLWTREGLNALDLAIANGANPEKVCIDHSDVRLDEEYIMGILKRGALVEFDDFGKEFYCDQRRSNYLLGSFASDVERVKFIKKLCDKGYAKQILASNDICMKSMLHTYGGWGYDHIITNIVPMMEDFGISSGDIELITKINPRNLLDK